MTWFEFETVYPKFKGFKLKIPKNCQQSVSSIGA
jgi:hypothetical protein